MDDNVQLIRNYVITIGAYRGARYHEGMGLLEEFFVDGDGGVDLLEHVDEKWLAVGGD